jgi:hypothetical protein
MPLRPSLPVFARNGVSASESTLLRWLCIVAIVALTALAYWPGIHGDWGRDDFMQLAFGRLVGSPWPPFLQDHYVPAPGTVFRPLGFASFWLSATLFGTDYAWNAIGDLALHAAVALALFGLLRRAAIPPALACAATLLFALHPAAIGTALWWSARFDLLAALFVLLALRAGLAYREDGRAIALAGTLAATMAALLSKEIGLVVVPALSLLWLRWARAEPQRRGAAWRAIGLVWLCALVWFGWRWFALGTLSSGLTGAMPLTQALIKGMLDWLHQAIGYLSFAPRLGAATRLALCAALAVALTVIVVVALRKKMSRRAVDLAFCGLCLIVLPAVLQAPVAALNAAPLGDGVSAVEAAMQSRLYYLGAAGAAMLIAALLAPAWARPASRWPLAAWVPLLLAALVFGSVSHRHARAFAQRSAEIAKVAHEAVAAVAALDLPASRCHVVFLGVEPAPEWSIYVSMDSVLKALSPDLGRVAHCWFDADYPTFFHLLAAPVDAADARPSRPLQIDGASVPWRRIGGLVVAYARPPERPLEAQELDGLRFLRYEHGRFVDVTADAAAGRLSVRLQ